MIRFEHVTKRYEEEKRPVFEDFSEEIKTGEFILLTGESGIGKSTFIRMLLKETDTDEGEIWVLEQRLNEISDRQLPFYRRKLGVVFQESYLVPEQTVYRNVELARLITGGRRKENRTVITSLFRLLGISHLHNRYPEELSGGEKQKVCLARALVNYPSILLADEPTGNLSPGESREFMKLFELVHRQGITVVVATHDKESAKGLAYREIALGESGEENHMDKTKMQDITLQASDDTLYTVLNAIEEHLCRNGCPDDIKTEVLISVEEIYVNIAHYAYGGKPGEATVQMEVTQNPRVCRVVFRDKGVPYNPLKKEDPNLFLSAEEREVGGLGIFMVKQYMDKMEYQYEDGCNILAIEKHLPSSESPETEGTD